MFHLCVSPLCFTVMFHRCLSLLCFTAVFHRCVSEPCFTAVSPSCFIAVFHRRVPELVFLAEWWSETENHCYVNPDDAKYFGKEHVVLIMNHTYEVDWLMGWLMADRCNTLGVRSWHGCGGKGTKWRHFRVGEVHFWRFLA